MAAFGHVNLQNSVGECRWNTRECLRLFDEIFSRNQNEPVKPSSDTFATQITLGNTSIEPIDIFDDININYQYASVNEKTNEPRQLQSHIYNLPSLRMNTFDQNIKLAVIRHHLDSVNQLCSMMDAEVSASLRQRQQIEDLVTENVVFKRKYYDSCRKNQSLTCFINDSNEKRIKLENSVKDLSNKLAELRKENRQVRKELSDLEESSRRTKIASSQKQLASTAAVAPSGTGSASGPVVWSSGSKPFLGPGRSVDPLARHLSLMLPANRAKDKVASSQIAATRTTITASAANDASGPPRARKDSVSLKDVSKDDNAITQTWHRHLMNSLKPRSVSNGRSTSTSATATAQSRSISALPTRFPSQLNSIRSPVQRAAVSKTQIIVDTSDADAPISDAQLQPHALPTRRQLVSPTGQTQATGFKAPADIAQSSSSSRKRKLPVVEPGSLVGQFVSKRFGSLGTFTGLVSNYDKLHGYYRVEYLEDGDSEELTERQVLKLLVRLPADTDDTENS